MARQNFELTAEYFDKRARKAPSHPLKSKFEKAAALYRERAGSQPAVRAKPAQDSRSDIPRRRQRLIELFRTYSN